jgi:hypothetical protein
MRDDSQTTGSSRPPHRSRLCESEVKAVAVPDRLPIISGQHSPHQNVKTVGRHSKRTTPCPAPVKYPQRETVDDCEGIANERRCVAGSRNLPPRSSLSLRSTKYTGTGMRVGAKTSVSWERLWL